MKSETLVLDVRGLVTPVLPGLKDVGKYRKEHRALVRKSDALCERHDLGRDGFYKGVRVAIHPASRGLCAPGAVDVEHMQILAHDDLLCAMYNFDRKIRFPNGREYRIQPVARREVEL